MKCKLLNKIANLFSKPEALAASAKVFRLAYAPSVLVAQIGNGNRWNINSFLFMSSFNTNSLIISNNTGSDVFISNNSNISSPGVLTIDYTKSTAGFFLGNATNLFIVLKDTNSIYSYIYKLK